MAEADLCWHSSSELLYITLTSPYNCKPHFIWRKVGFIRRFITCIIHTHAPKHRFWELIRTVSVRLKTPTIYVWKRNKKMIASYYPKNVKYEYCHYATLGYTRDESLMSPWWPKVTCLAQTSYGIIIICNNGEENSSKLLYSEESIKKSKHLYIQIYIL